MKPCPRKHSSVRTLLPWVHSAGKPHLANPHPMEQHSIVVHCKGAMWHNPWQYKHGPNLAQWVNSISTSVGPFRGGWIDRGTQVWVPKVIPGAPRRCLYPSLSAKRKRLGPLCSLGLKVMKRKRLALWAILYGLFSTGGLRRILLRKCLIGHTGVPTMENVTALTRPKGAWLTFPRSIQGSIHFTMVGYLPCSRWQDPRCLH